MEGLISTSKMQLTVLLLSIVVSTSAFSQLPTTFVVQSPSRPLGRGSAEVHLFAVNNEHNELEHSSNLQKQALSLTAGAMLSLAVLMTPTVSLAAGSVTTKVVEPKEQLALENSLLAKQATSERLSKLAAEVKADENLYKQAENAVSKAESNAKNARKKLVAENEKLGKDRKKMSKQQAAKEKAQFGKCNDSLENSS